MVDEAKKGGGMRRKKAGVERQRKKNQREEVCSDHNVTPFEDEENTAVVKRTRSTKVRGKRKEEHSRGEKGLRDTTWGLRR